VRKRILFVDDEVMVLKGLRRMLFRKRNQWDMDFVSSGVEALEKMGESSCDVIVTDMLMPGMSGEELLKEVRKNHPKVVRITLSGQAHRDFAEGYIFPSHQDLVKPCDEKTLTRVIEDALRASDLQVGGRVKKILARIDSLPVLPKLIVDMVDALQQSPVDLDLVGDLASRDVGMSAKLLSLVNSPYFGFRRKVADPSQAVVLLGAEAMRALVLTLHAFSCFKPDGVPGFSLKLLWDHCTRTSCIAKQLALFEGLDKEAVGQVSMAALLHDLGKLLLCADFTDEYNRILGEVRETNQVVSEVERKVLGTTHAQIGAYLLALWGIPSEVVDVIANHHSPQALDGKVSMDLMLFSANLFDHHLTIINPSYVQPELPMARFEALGVADKIEMWRNVASKTLEKCDDQA